MSRYVVIHEPTKRLVKECMNKDYALKELKKLNKKRFGAYMIMTVKEYNRGIE